MIKQTTNEKLAELNTLFDVDVTDRTQALSVTVKTFLNDTNNRVLAKAAVLVEEQQLYALIPDLKQAYNSMLKNAVKLDANCTAKSAIMHSLVKLGCDDVDFFLEGIRYKQLEPSFGGAVDTAIDIRCSSAMGLVSTTYMRSMIELLGLLNDDEANARAGAIRAIRYAASYEAALVLRQKIMQGDTEPEIIGECFIALLQVEPRQSLSLVSSYLRQDVEVLYEMAALALGESHLDDAIEIIKKAWGGTFSIHQRKREMLIRAAVQHRSDEAFNWLLSLLVYAEENQSRFIVEQLSIYKSNDKLGQRIRKVLDENGDAMPLAVFEKSWLVG